MTVHAPVAGPERADSRRLTNCSRFAATEHARARGFDQSTLPMQIETLWPPKPSEFDSALRTFNGRAAPGT